MLKADGGSKSLDVSISAQLIEDYLSVQDAPFTQLGEGNIAAFSNGVVAIDKVAADKFELLLTERDWTVPSGWRVEHIDVPVPDTATGPEIAAVRVFEVGGSTVVGNGQSVGTTTLNVLCLFPAPDGCQAVSWMVRATIGSQAPGPWQPVANCDVGARSLLSQVRQVEVVDAGTDVGWIVYGITNDILQPQSGIVFAIYLWNYQDILRNNWTLRSRIPRSALPSTDNNVRIALAAAMTSAGPNSTYATVLCCYDDRTFYWSPLATGGLDLGSAGTYQSRSLPGGIVSQLTASPASDQVVPSPGNHVWDLFLIDATSSLWRYSIGATGLQSFRLVDPSRSPSNPPQAPSSANHLSLNTHGGARSAFLADGLKALWMLADVTSETGTWVRLGNVVKAISAPSPTGHAAQVYYATVGKDETTQNRLYHLTQSANGVWQNEKIAVFVVPDPQDPSKDLSSVSTVSIEIAVTDPAAKTPVPNVDITVSADQLTTLILGHDAAVQAGPGEAPIITTDGAGRASLRYWARTMSFPELTFAAAKDGYAGGSRSCQGDIVDTGDYVPPTTSLASRLSGDDDKAPSNGFALNTTTLTKAGLLPPTTTTSDGTSVVSMLNTIGGYMKAQSPAYKRAQGTSTPRKWQVTITGNGSGFTCQEVAADPPGALLGGWDDIAGDVLHWVKHAADAVAAWTVHVADDAIHFAVAGYNCVVRTVHEAAELAGTILQSIQKGLKDAEAFIRDVINFFKVLFDWSDILDTHQSLKVIFNFILENASQTKPLQDAINKKIDDLKGDIDSAFQNLDNYLNSGSTDSATSYTAKQPAGPTVSNDLSTKQYRTHLDQHGARCHYVLSHAKKHVRHHDLSPRTTHHAAQTSGFDTHWGPIKNSSDAKSFKSKLDSDHPPAESFLTTLAHDLSELIAIIERLTNAAIDGLKYVVDDIIAMVTKIAKDLSDALNYSPDIPLISWLYKHIITEGRDDLSILDLFCLCLAAPTTILFKLIGEKISPFNGQAPFARSDVRSYVSAQFSYRVTSASSDSSIPAAGRADLDETSVPHITAMSLGIAGGIIGLFASGLGTYLDYKTIKDAMVKENATEQPELPSVGLPSLNTFLGWVDLFGNITATGCVFPFLSLPGLKKGDRSDIISCLYWSSQCVPLVSDLVFLFIDGKLTRQQKGFGPIAEGLFGCVIAGIGVTYCVIGGASRWDIANCALTVFPRPFRMFIAFVIPDEDPLAIPENVFILGTIMTTDAIGLAGGTVTQIGASIADNAGQS